MLLAKFQELLTYPTRRWGEPPSDRWVSLCTQMRDYQAPCKELILAKERKWELVSALQKSIRRGNKNLALNLVSAIDIMPDEYAYFWKRFCVIACEDIGPGDDVLATFVVACATVFSPKKTDHESYDLLYFLTEHMCDLSNRSAHAPEMKPEQKQEQAVTPQREIAPEQEQSFDIGLGL